MAQACKQCGTVAGSIAGSLCPACLLRLATLPESRVPDFDIETLLGSGTGTTYLARATDGALLAVKKLGSAPERSDALDDLDDALRLVDHPHLARTIAIDVDVDGTVQLIRGYVAGRAFAEWHATATPDARASAREALAAALAHLHEAGLAHGHVTATNIVIGAGSRAILLDAGARPALSAVTRQALDMDGLRRDDIIQLQSVFARTGNR